MLNYKNIKNTRQWSATIGLSEGKFKELVVLFQEAYERKYTVSISEAAANLKKTFVLPTYEDCLFFVLYQLKNSQTYDVLGFLINTNGATAYQIFNRYLALLDATLFENGEKPKRNFENIEEFKTLLKENKEIILDVTELPIERNSDYKKQKEDYSGKKKDTRKKRC